MPRGLGIQSRRGGRAPGRLRKMPPPPGTLEIRGSWVQCGLLDSPPSPSCMFTDLSSNPERAQSGRKCGGGQHQDFFQHKASCSLLFLPTIHLSLPPFSARLPKIYTCLSTSSPPTPQLAASWPLAIPHPPLSLLPPWAPATSLSPNPASLFWSCPH